MLIMTATTSTFLVPYPRGVIRVLLRFPLFLYRVGLGHLLDAIFIMILTTRGRQSGRARHTAVEYRRHGSKIYIISGWGTQPDWFKNLLVDPLATIQLGQHTFSALADPVNDTAEALRVLNLFRRVAPWRYDLVLGRMIADEVNAQSLPDLSQRFTIMRLNIISDEPTLPGLKANWLWLWPLLLVGLISLAVVFALSKRPTEKS